MGFSADDRPCGIEGVEVAAIDGAIVVYEAATRTFHELSGLAGSVWLLCDGETEVGSMAAELGALSGVAAADLADDVAEALDRLAGAGLLAGFDVQRLVAVPEADLFAADGSLVLTPPLRTCEVAADEHDWAGSVVLRLGARRDLLVAVRADTEAALDELHALFGAWVETAPPPEALAAFPMLGARLTPLDAQAPAEPGAPRIVPQLRRGPRVIARSRRPIDVLHALAHVLGGAVAQHDDPDGSGRMWIGLRAFAGDAGLVLADIDLPEMVNDPRLATAGIHELAAWSVAVEPDGTAVVPPSLDDLRWDEVGVDAPSAEWGRHRLAGVVSMRERDRSPVQLLAKIVRYSDDARWFTMLTSMAEQGHLVHVTDHAALRDEITRLVAPVGATG